MNVLKHGIQPFWFWNGEMKDEEIQRQIHEMKKQGFKGFLIHPRQGMEIPYLSKKFFKKVRLAVETAKKQEMEVWLYDEFPYPSGVSGGKVTLDHPEYVCKELTKTCQVCRGGEKLRMYAPWGKVLMARAYPVVEGQCRWDTYIDLKEYVGSGYKQDVFQMSGLTQYNKKRYFQGELSQYLYWKVPDGIWKVYLYTEVVMRHFKYFETFIDPLNPEAVRCFLQTTHEQYKKYVGDEFGKTIRGIFTDEITAFPPFHPWSSLLPGLVKEKFGLELTEFLPALSEDMGEITDRVRYAYWSTATERFIESWDKQVYEWCDKNQLMYIGEKPILRSGELKYTHVPGIDAGHQKFGSKAVLAQSRYRSNGKIVSSAAHFYGKPAVLCEAFHSIGWGMTLQDAKWIFDWLAVMGIDWFITHGAYYTTDGLKKHDAPPSFFYQMPWWKHTHILADYADRLQQFLINGKRNVSVLILDPITSTWTEIDQRLKMMNEDFAQFQNELLRKGIDYYVMDPQLFAEGQVSEKEGKTVYENQKDSYEIIVLPFMTNIEPEAVSILQDYVKQGGTVLAVGTLPFKEFEHSRYGDWIEQAFGIDPKVAYQRYFSDDHMGKEGWNGKCFFSSDMYRVIDEIFALEESKRIWKVKVPDNGEILQIQCTGKEGKKQLFLVNVGAKRQSVEITKGMCTVSREIDGGESLFLEAGEQDLHNLEKLIGNQEILEIDTTQKIPMRVLAENALRIGTWEMKLSDGQSAIVDSVPLIDQMDMAGLGIQICQKDYFGCPKELQFPEIQAEYIYHFVNRTNSGTQVSLVMEPGTLLGEWEIQLNDRKICMEDFKEKTVYMPSNLSADVSDILCNGRNSLKIKMKSDVSYGGIRNPLYLCGKFAVMWDKQEAVLESEREQGCIDDLTGNGLPYYAGTVEFVKKIPEEQLKKLPKDSKVCIRMKNEKFHDAVQLKLGEEVVGTSIYSPYVFEISTNKLKEYGELTVCVDNSLSRLFEGEYFDEERHQYVKI